MHTPKRLEDAINKLYNAFHNNQLHPECCRRCAVGNILEQNDSWKHLSDHYGSTKLNYVGIVNQNLGKTFNGYTPLELLHIETTFLKACGYSVPLKRSGKKPSNPTDKDVLFKGLCETVKLLCKLDNVNDVMNYEPFLQHILRKSNTLEISTTANNQSAS